MDSGKVNITPPLHQARWYQLVGEKLGNTTELYPNGDDVQAIKQWTPPETWEGMSDEIISRILADIDKGLPDGNRYSDGPNVKDRAAWLVVVEHAPTKTKEQARDIIRKWVKNNVLEAKPYANPKTHKEVSGLWLVQAKKPPPPNEELPF